jgi:alpha-glucoside transport system permease protein
MSAEALPTSGARLAEIAEAKAKAAKLDHRLKRRSPWASITAAVIAILWTIPTLGLFITSFRPQLDAIRTGWWTVWQDPNFTLENYEEALFGGTTKLYDYFVNSIVITVPAVIIPVTIAALAAYGLAWMNFRGRGTIFLVIFALQIVPLQVALVPLLKASNSFGLTGTFWPVWIAHAIFALPLAIYLLHNFMKDVPGELIEAARVDGAGHVRIFFQVLMPLLVPALAAFSIFQFLWVWNDLLVGLTMIGGTPSLAPLTVRVAELSGTRGSAWHLLAAGAFISMVVPLIVFLSLQRYFVRGLLAGSVKG